MSSEIHVDLGRRSYPIRVGRDLLSSVGEVAASLGKGHRALLISDDRVAPLYAEPVMKALSSAGIQCAEFIIPAGESSKSQQHLFEAYDVALDEGLDRNAVVIALGGGVVGDLAGYMAASYLRGVRFLQIPTTLLAMVDSSVGGKTSINLPKGKNLIGAFHQPVAVLADLGVLQTLPPREFSAGMAEVIKYGVIKDRSLFDHIVENADTIKSLDPERIEELVVRSCRIKAEVVQEDEREGGLRAILNFGHTLGHAIEQATEYGAYLHGEAISIGMIYAAQVSETVLNLPEEETRNLRAAFQAFDLPVKRPALSWGDIVKAMARDKKSIDEVPRFVLARRMGSVAFGCEVSADLLEKHWNEMDVV